MRLTDSVGFQTQEKIVAERGVQRREQKAAGAQLVEPGRGDRTDGGGGEDAVVRCAGRVAVLTVPGDGVRAQAEGVETGPGVVGEAGVDFERGDVIGAGPVGQQGGGVAGAGTDFENRVPGLGSEVAEQLDHGARGGDAGGEGPVGGPGGCYGTVVDLCDQRDTGQVDGLQPGPGLPDTVVQAITPILTTGRPPHPVRHEVLPRHGQKRVPEPTTAVEPAGVVAHLLGTADAQVLGGQRHRAAG